MNHATRIVCLVALLGPLGCNSALITSEVDPAADAKRAMALGDRHLVGYMGFGLVVPGTPQGFQYWTYAPGVQVVSHVTDTSQSAEIEKAADYAIRYNRVILCK